MFLTTGNCPIYFEKKGFEYLKSFLSEKAANRQIFILTDENCRRHCWPLIEQVFDGLPVPHLITLPAGERFKNLESTSLVWQALLESEARRMLFL